MLPTCVEARGRIACGVAASLAVSIVAGLIATSPAQARHHHRFHRYGGVAHHHRSAGGGYRPPFSAIVVDAKAGKVLYSDEAKEPRHPASITKVMTLYLLFEQLERGALSMDSQLRISEHAASMAPTKLGLPPGGTIAVSDAIKAVVTQSANDIAVAIAETIGGSEDTFAEMMTRKAHALGMNDTQFVNASGLPDDQQITTAYDLAVLARAIQERFPRYYPLFATRSFRYGRAVMRNHNHLLGRIEGLDGIKTGYTRSSGFNLMTNVRRDGRQIVAVVMGGSSAAGRDRIMVDLIAQNIDHASEGPHVAPVQAETERPRPAVVAEASQAVRAPAGPSSIAPASVGEDGRLPATVQAYAPTTTPSSLRWSVAGKLVQVASERQEQAGGQTEASTTANAGKIYTDRLPARQPISTASIAATKAEPPKEAMLGKPEPVQIPPTRPLPTSASASAAESPRAPAARLQDEVDARPKVAPGLGWMIQLGALPEQDKAQEMLQRAKTRGSGVLARAESFTEKVTKDGTTLYRARFAGFDENAAQTACKVLKRNGFACFATRG
jgi:D-alanyl-D-alanine carboxypeptidase